MRQCLVTGGAGFIGSAIAPFLVENYDQVIAVDSLHPQVHPARSRPDALHSDVKLIVGDVSKRKIWDEILSDLKPEVIIHLAAETGTGQSLSEGSRHAKANVLGTTQMLDALVRHHRIPKRIILSSSRAVYGEGAWRDTGTGETVYPGLRSKHQLEAGQWDFPRMESLPFDAATTTPNPTNIYASTKLSQEHILRAWTSAFEVEHFILRLQNVYGPGQSLYNAYTGIVQIFCQIAKEKKRIPVYEDGQITRDFVFIDDVARAIATAAELQGHSGNYDVGSGVTTTLLSLASLIARQYGAPEPVVTGQFRNGDIRHASCNTARTKRDLNWQPTVALRDGVERLADWIRSRTN